jgi:hypothetical protein
MKRLKLKIIEERFTPVRNELHRELVIRKIFDTDPATLHRAYTAFLNELQGGNHVSTNDERPGF